MRRTRHGCLFTAEGACRSGCLGGGALVETYVPSLLVHREADVLVVAVGKMGLVGGEHLRPGQTVVDVGIHMDGDTMRGDVRFEEAEPLAAAITPVPGGVGSVTTAILASHVVEAAKRGIRP